ncbi:MAG: ADP-glyceromanno-heptose 6-epimerase, partial [Alphaproteobacteria bacterium]|nr:ADP-glyceromanno-heptose 6-epimerase [Alphaproteobacteria bacterium]
MIIVTGGAGFIGSYLVGELSRKHIGPIIICDRLRDGDKWKNIAKHNIADIIDPDSLGDWLDTNGQNVDCIFHLGACSSTTESDADYIWQNNVKFTQMLWDFAAQNKKRLIYASSAATYGDGSKGFKDDNSLEAISDLRPLNAYGWSKKVSDIRAVQMADAGYAPEQWAGLKFFNVYGPNEYHKGGQKSVAVQLFDKINEDGKAVLFRSHHPNYEDGGQMRDFVWVGDVVDVMLWLYE